MRTIIVSLFVLLASSSVFAEDAIVEMLNKLGKSIMNLFLSQRNNSSYIRTGLGTRTGLGSVDSTFPRTFQ